MQLLSSDNVKAETAAAERLWGGLQSLHRRLLRSPLDSTQTAQLLPGWVVLRKPGSSHW